jgi:hypothetical protein
VLRQSLVIDVGQVITELVIALVKRNTGGAAVQQDLFGRLDDLRASEVAASWNTGGSEGVIVGSSVDAIVSYARPWLSQKSLNTAVDPRGCDGGRRGFAAEPPTLFADWRRSS